MISLDLMKSSEVRKAGDRSKCISSWTRFPKSVELGYSLTELFSPVWCDLVGIALRCKKLRKR